MQRQQNPRTATQFRGLYAMSATVPVRKTKEAATGSRTPTSTASTKKRS
jgi:hypothetical protein